MEDLITLTTKGHLFKPCNIYYFEKQTTNKHDEFLLLNCVGFLFLVLNILFYFKGLIILLRFTIRWGKSQVERGWKSMRNGGETKAILSVEEGEKTDSLGNK
jgi:hypothetical protein